MSCTCTHTSGVIEQLGALGHSLALGPLTPPLCSLTVDAGKYGLALFSSVTFANKTKNNRHKDENKK